MRRSSLRLYPGGRPKTHLIKLRTLKQCQLTTIASEWGMLTFFPNDPSSFMEFRAAPATIGPHKLLKFTFKNGTTVAPTPQPYGWDQWMGDGSTGAQYDHWMVLGSRTTINFIQGATVEGGVDERHLAGFGSTTYGATNFDIPTFAGIYQFVDSTEISDWMNAGVVKNPTTLKKVGAGARLVGKDQSFVFNWSLKKEKARVRRLGVLALHALWAGSGHDEQPPLRPVAHFMVGDIGAGTTSTFNCFVEVVYTIRMFEYVVPNESTHT